MLLSGRVITEKGHVAITLEDVGDEGKMADLDFETATTSYKRAQDAGLFRDPLSGIRPAGVSTTMFEDTAERDLQSEIYFQRPPTPPEQRKYSVTKAKKAHLVLKHVSCQGGVGGSAQNFFCCCE